MLKELPAQWVFKANNMKKEAYTEQQSARERQIFFRALFVNYARERAIAHQDRFEMPGREVLTLAEAYEIRVPETGGRILSNPDFAFSVSSEDFANLSTEKLGFRVREWVELVTNVAELTQQ